MILEQEFYKNCDNEKCLRHSFISKNCLKEFRRKLCYSKYIQQLEKNRVKLENQKIKRDEKNKQEKVESYIQRGKEIKEYLDKKERGEIIEYEVDEKWVEFRAQIIERDKECLVWKILTLNERSYILKCFYAEFMSLNKILDVAHIISRSESPKLIYDFDNVFLCSRYFHSLLDQYKDLVTRMPIKNADRIKWINRLMQENKVWKENYNYEKFWEEKIE
jgi:hypothetical protein